MKDSLKAQTRSLLSSIANDIENGHDSDGGINISAVLTAINAVALELYSQQRHDAVEIGGIVEKIIKQFPTLGKSSVAAFATKELCQSDNGLEFASTLKRVTEFVDEAYEARRGRASATRATLTRK